MASDAYNAGYYTQRASNTNAAGNAALGFMNLGSEGVKLAEKVANLIQGNRDKAEAEMASVGNLKLSEYTTNIGLALDNIAQNTTNPNDYQRNANDYIDLFTSDDQVRLELGEMGVPKETIDNLINSGQIATTKKLLQANVNDNLTRMYQTTYQQTATTMAESIAANNTDINTAMDEYRSAHAKLGDASILDPTGTTSPDNPSVRAGMAATIVLSNAEKSMAAAIKQNPYLDQTDYINQALQEFDAAMAGAYDPNNPYSAAGVEAERITLKSEMESRFETAKAENEVAIEEGLRQVASQVSIPMANGTLTFSELYNSMVSAGLTGNTAVEQAKIIEYVAQIIANTDSLSELGVMVEDFKAVMGSALGIRPTASGDDPLSASLSVYNDLYGVNDENSIASRFDNASQSESRLFELFQIAATGIVEKGTNLYNTEFTANAEAAINSVLYNWGMNDEDKYRSLDSLLSNGLITDQQYEEAVGEVPNINSTFKVSCKNAEDIVTSLLNTYDLTSQEKASIELLISKGNGTKALYNLVLQYNGSVPEQVLRDFVDNGVETILTSNMYDDFSRRIGRELSRNVSGSQYNTSLLKTSNPDPEALYSEFTFGGQTSLSSFYSEYVTGEYNFAIEPESFALVKTSLMNANNSDLSLNSIMDATADILYGTDYKDLDDYQKNITELNALGAFSEILALRILSQCYDAGNANGKEYREVTVNGYGKGIMTKTGVVLYLNPATIESTFDTMPIYANIYNVGTPEYEAVWGKNNNWQSATINVDSSKSMTTFMQRKDGKYIPLSDSNATGSLGSILRAREYIAKRKAEMDDEEAKNAGN